MKEIENSDFLKMLKNGIRFGTFGKRATENPANLFAYNLREILMNLPQYNNEGSKNVIQFFIEMQESSTYSRYFLCYMISGKPLESADEWCKLNILNEGTTTNAISAAGSGTKVTALNIAVSCGIRYNRTIAFFENNDPLDINNYTSAGCVLRDGFNAKYTHYKKNPDADEIAVSIRDIKDNVKLRTLVECIKSIEYRSHCKNYFAHKPAKFNMVSMLEIHPKWIKESQKYKTIEGIDRRFISSVALNTTVDAQLKVYPLVFGKNTPLTRDYDYGNVSPAYFGLTSSRFFHEFEPIVYRNTYVFKTDQLKLKHAIDGTLEIKLYAPAIYSYKEDSPSGTLIIADPIKNMLFKYFGNHTASKLEEVTSTYKADPEYRQSVDNYIANLDKRSAGSNLIFPKNRDARHNYHSDTFMGGVVKMPFLAEDLVTGKSRLINDPVMRLRGQDAYVWYNRLMQRHTKKGFIADTYRFTPFFIFTVNSWKTYTPSSIGSESVPISLEADFEVSDNCKELVMMALNAIIDDLSNP